MLTLADCPSDPTKPNATAGEPRGVHCSRDGDGALGDGGGDDDDDGDPGSRADVATLTPNPPQTTADASKNKKKRKAKKKKTTTQALALKQSSPPRVPLSDLFPTQRYPCGELLSGAGGVENTARTTSEEHRHGTRAHVHDDAFLNNYRRAAEVHRQVRYWVQDNVRPGQTLSEIAEGIDDGVRALLGNRGLERGSCLRSGLGFPTGLALNNCVAHYTPNPGQKEIVLQAEDVMKVDFGVHIDGWIVDSAFTMSFDPTYDNLLAATRDATNAGIKVSVRTLFFCAIKN